MPGQSFAMTDSTISAANVRHAGWVRAIHWIASASFLALAFSGVVILMCHPRLYWGEVGNDLTPALFELPISRNHQHGGWEKGVSFFADKSSTVSASRTFEIFNQNGWGRSLHFLAAWFLVAAGMIYLVAGVLTGHFWRHLVPRTGELSLPLIRQEIMNHLRLRIRPGSGGPQYGLLQKCAYVGVIFGALPLAVLTGLAMSPAITAAYPFLSAMFGGFQSARTVHFFASLALGLFLVVHVTMIIKSGFKRQMRGMTLGK
jgi:thiosulfate reductase cytochrome b subunit